MDKRRSIIDAKKKARSRARTDQQAVLSAVVTWAAGDDEPMPVALVDRLLALRIPWFVVLSRQTGKRLAAEASARVRQFWGDYFAKALQTLDGESAEFQSVSLQMTFDVIPVRTNTPGKPATIATVRGAGVEDAVSFQIVNLVRVVGLASLLRCECRRPFVKVGRRVYCSTKCQQRVFAREARKAERNAREQFMEDTRRGKLQRSPVRAK